ncbi:MAG: hypothetical protein HZC42_02600 [Candidatus Eisenbacteria bacterium]|nr:hypothetical protein [Candidatus Eisenbacteria bacterium]
MTRIFDALRKAQATRAPAVPIGPVPVPPAPFPAGRAGTPRAAAERRVEGAEDPRLAVVPFTAGVALPEDVMREMTALRVSLEVGLAERMPRTVMFASSQRGEGTTTVAVQFAAALARDDRLRVLLVDAHARRPALDAGAAAASGPAGAERTALPPGADGAAARNLDLLPLTKEQRRAGILAPAVVRDRLEALAGGYDWIVLDGPPVLESPDAAPLAAVVDGIVVVVRAGRTKRPVLSRAVDLLRRAGARVLGSVLNRRRLEIPEFIYRRI